ncbi:MULTISPECIES: hypothetical protein [Methylococcus]|uniref:Uncharacterized protein n=1 Tax=Methylococcus capsulatus TaxID=414 RepID=A0ABZ2F5N9_METCP|nr:MULTISPECIES: hypothetical protein [Methylococcus]
MATPENQIELDLIAKLGDLKYTYREGAQGSRAKRASATPPAKP